MTKKIELKIEGMTCAHCAKGIEDHLRELGLSDARVDFSSSAARFSEPAGISVSEVISKLRKIGYKAQIFNPEDSSSKRRFSSLQIMTFFCLLLATPLMFAGLLQIEFLHNPLVQLALTVPVMASGGLYFTKSAISSIRIKKPNMDVLIAIGTFAAFAYSLSGTILGLGPDFLFYETSASIIAIVLLGNFLEARAVSKTEDSITRLQQLTPDSIRVKDPETAQIREVPLDQVQLGAIIVLSPGDRVPVDGEIVDGFGEIDEAFLTGESIPRTVRSPEQISSGGLIVGGNMLIKATAVGEESSLVKIIRTIQEARSSKPDLERLADRITAFFVPVVLSISFLTFNLNILFGISAAESLLRAIAVLVIACPCALGLATPTAVTVALGLASSLGILIRKTSVFETLPLAKRYFFDKTGTLTDGRFKVEEFVALNAKPQDEVKKVILGLEAFSHHPIAIALRDFCSDSGSISATEFEHTDERRGLGIFGKTLTGISYELSSREVEAPYNLALRENEVVVALIKLSDSVRQEAPALMSFLTRKGIELEILSGDSSTKTEQIAKELSISKSSARLLPKEKAERIAQHEKTRVAFVGDGINDAAALSRADVGITFGSASDMARHSADVTIASGGLEKIAYLIELSEKTTASIKQNLFWAFFYNIIFIPFAAFGMLSPMHAAFAMVLSDLIVVANSLRLKLWKPQPLS